MAWYGRDHKELGLGDFKGEGLGQPVTRREKRELETQTIRSKDTHTVGSTSLAAISLPTNCALVCNDLESLIPFLKVLTVRTK